MKRKVPKWMIAAFIAVPLLYFLAQLLPYYHSGGTTLPSLGSIFWFPGSHQETIDFIALFYPGFRVNELTGALLSTQLIALFIIILMPALPNKGIVASLTGVWGITGLVTFFTTRSLTFSPVMVYGGIAGIIMLLLFAGAIVLSVLYFYPIYKEYKANLALIREAENKAAAGGG